MSVEALDGAFHAECALEAANARIRLRRQIPIATFAIRLEREHDQNTRPIVRENQPRRRASVSATGWTPRSDIIA
jgi:hypothetical protein